MSRASKMNEKIRTIAVTGATGFIGRALTKRLLDAGYDVVALSRDVQRAQTRLPARCRIVQWSPDHQVNPKLLGGCDAVVHLAGAGIADGRWTEARKRVLLESRVDGTRSIVGALRLLPASSRPRVFLSASAIGYYGDRGVEILDEKAEPGHGFLAGVCRAWEDEVFRAAPLGVRTAAVRIGIVLGKQGGALRQLLPPFRLGLGGRIGGGRQWMSWIHLDDLIGLMLHVLEDEAAAGPINGVAPSPVTNRRFTRELSRALRRPAVLPVPAFALRIGLGEMSAVLLASQRVRPAAAETLGYAFRFPRLRGALAQICADLSEELEREEWLPRPPEEVFPFFADPRNLEKITPEFLHFLVLATTTPEVDEGTLIDYRLRLRGFPIRWQSRIEDWSPMRRFVDRQVKGPYALWHHTHEFEPYDGGTIIRDRVRYALPLGPLGQMAAGGFVAADLERMFDHRSERMRDIFREPVWTHQRKAS